MEMVAATGNKDKLEEFRRMLTPLGITVLSPAELGISFDAEETGETFEENARIKARALFELCAKPSLADDSGLCIDALGGRPGVHSARYLGYDTPYGQKNAALLLELAQVPPEKRAAQFVAAICCVLSSAREITCLGVCEGAVGYEPKGAGGFGYDPIFMVGEKSFAELSGAEKDAVSHRGKALRELVEQLRTRIHE